MSHTLQNSSTVAHLVKIYITKSLKMFVHKSNVAYNLAIHNESQ
jgi:hypothetical protein